MTCPHFEINIVKRSEGGSAVSAAAYQTGEKLFSDWDRKYMYHGTKEELVLKEILLPAHAPPEFADRNKLWNSAEAAEPNWNSQLTRRLKIALPVELSMEDNIALAREYCEKEFASKGMIVDLAVHDPEPPNHNPHFHVLLTMRPLDEKGNWAPKARKEYVLDKDGNRIRGPNGKYKVRKIPTVDWNARGNAEIWRHDWENLQNQYLERAGRAERVCMKSYERQGLDTIPTVHMGPAVMALERKGIRTDVGNLNREIRAVNAMIRFLKGTILKLTSWLADLRQAIKEIEMEPEEIYLVDLLNRKFDQRANERFLTWRNSHAVKKAGSADFKRFVARFAGSYLANHPMKCVKEVLYGMDGIIDEKELENDIYKAIKAYTVKDVAKLVKNLISVLKIEAYSPELPLDLGHIHFSNGTYSLEDESFTEKKVFCRNRLPVCYDPDAPIPERWLEFLDGLLHTEDVYTLQEFLGYCMITTNKAQVMMCILGKGGEGKSRIPLVLSRILGDSMNNYSLEKLATDKFAKYDQIGKLLMVDDELKTEALSDTSTLKSVVTMEDKTNLEKKHSQSFQGELYVRVLALGNGPLSSLYDKSDGFFRRQIVLQTIPKPKDRIDDPYLIKALLEEVEGITQWMIVGLHRLIRNNYQFTLSKRVKEAMKEMREDEDNILSFYASTGYIRFEKGTVALTKDLYTAYRKWCEDNCEPSYSSKTFASRLKHDAESLGITYDRNLDASGGKKARGYRGICVQINPYFS